VDWSRTVAFGPWNAQQGVRINVRGREPQGIVAPGADYESLRDEIRCALLEATAPQTGRPVVAQVWNREEIYDGPFLDEMPDLVLALRSPFAASPLQPGLWSPTGWGSGDHSLTGMTILRGPAVAPGRVEGSELIDVVPTILYLLGQPLPAALDGRVLTRALDRAFVAAHPIRHLEPGDHGPAAGLAGEVLTPEEEAEVQARLRGLGYL
jgi:predicted AlkP superfamily phosphohydrolase/phosphomutase